LSIVQLGSYSREREALRALRAGGAWPYQGPEILPWGQRWVKLRDPDNFLIAIYENLPH
jgi:hypothetical protein